ncbi:MAG: SRPBCC domain-containing protein [Planctomycetota bacterium]
MNENFANWVGPARLEIVRELPASRERVWEYFVNPELRQKWFCSGETGVCAGEPFVMDFDHSRISNSSAPDDGCGGPIVMRGTILEYEPPSKLAYRWPGATEDEDSIVTIELTALGDKTRLRLIHSQLSNPDFGTAASVGWHAHLDLLLDLTNDQPARDFWVHFAETKLQYEKRSVETANQL